MAQTVANKIKSIQILEKPSSRAATASAPSDEQPQGEGLFGASACSKTPNPASSEAVVRIVHEGAPKTVSDMDPSKRRAHYKPVTPDEDWRPEWGPRKRRPGLTKEDRALMRRVATDPLMVEDVYERYDNDGNLLSRDVKTGDAVYARKLAVSTRLDLLKKWAPEKYGDKVEAKTDSSLASRILAARQRVAGK